MVKSAERPHLTVWEIFLTNMDNIDHILELCPEIEGWQAGMIAGLLDKKDEQIKALQEVKNAAEFFFGRSRCFEAVEQFRAECC